MGFCCTMAVYKIFSTSLIFDSKFRNYNRTEKRPQNEVKYSMSTIPRNLITSPICTVLKREIVLLALSCHICQCLTGLNYDVETRALKPDNQQLLSPVRKDRPPELPSQAAWAAEGRPTASWRAPYLGKAQATQKTPRCHQLGTVKSQLCPQPSLGTEVVGACCLPWQKPVRVGENSSVHSPV